MRRVWLLAPLLVSLGSVLAQLSTGNPCDGSAACEIGWQGLSWTIVVFPHALAFPLLVSPLGSVGTVAVLLILDGALIAGARHALPVVLDWRQAIGVAVGWLLLSAVTVWAAPRLMTFARSFGPA